MKRWAQQLGPAMLACGIGCAAAEEAPRVSLPVVVEGSGMTPVETDLGYVVTLSEGRLVADDLEFTIAGEAHLATAWQRLWDRLVPPAHAHPGHFEGGDVTGELPGHFIIDWVAGNAAPLGLADLIAGDYQSVNFTFGRATPDDGLAEGDPLLGHTAHFTGRATRAGSSYAFRIALDAPTDRRLVGAPFPARIEPGSQVTLGFELMTRDPREGDTLFDGVDFAALQPETGMMELAPGSAAPATARAYDLLRGSFMTHDHFQVSLLGPEE